MVDISIYGLNTSSIRSESFERFGKNVPESGT